MNKTAMCLLLIIIIAWTQEKQIPWTTSSDAKQEDVSKIENTSIKQGKETVFSDTIITREIESALAEPYRYVRTGRLGKLLVLLKNNRDIDIQVIPSDSLRDDKIHSTEFRRNYYDRCVLNTIKYAQTRQSNKDAAKKALFNAALISFNNLDRPQLALSMYELAEASGYENAFGQVKKIKHYIEHDLPHAVLLKIPWRSKTEKEKQDYADQLEDILRKKPDSMLKLKFSRQIGDVYYNMEKYGPMMKWYRKAAAVDSNIVRDTPVGYRMNIGKKVMLRQKQIYAIYAVYVIIIILLLLSIYWSRDFRTALFLRRIIICIPVFLVIAVITLLFDFALTSGSIEAVLSESDVSVPKPIIPFSVFDISFIKGLMIILILGSLPILISIFYTSFKKQISKILVIIIIFLTVVSTWSHFILLKVFDNKLNKRAATSNSHIYFDGELEKMLVDNPKKVLKTKPDLLSSGNKDLNHFIKEKKPELLKENE